MEFINTIIPWTPFIPMLGAILLGFFGKGIQRRFGETIVGIIGCSPPLIAAIFAYSAFGVLIEQEPTARNFPIPLFTWFSIGDLHIDWAFRYDPLSALMLLIITGIGFLIHVYSMGYMRGDKSIWRFFSYTNLFLFAMLLLVLGDNLMVMFLGWEGVGICSYLLIGFWFDNESNAIAGKKAFIVNRIGDLGFLVGVFLFFMYSSTLYDVTTLSFAELAERINLLAQEQIWGFPLLEVIAFCFFVGATGKSAQIPLYVWLPDAMAGPTPVSALIHAATMVTAGIYMMARMNFLYSLTPNVLSMIAIIAALTCFFAATIGMAQFDIKKVLAYSTISQLGYMFLGVGVGAYSAGVFHLLTHAAFKAALFMGAGSVIVALHHEQDMRKMGGLIQKMPVTGTAFIAATLAIMGFPGTSGFFSKDEILWKAWSQGSPFLWTLAFAAAGITSFYMWRLVFMTFFGTPKTDELVWKDCREQPKRTTLPIVILALAALLLGGLNLPHFLGGHSTFSQYLSPIVHDIQMTPTKNVLPQDPKGVTRPSGKVGNHKASAETTEWILMLLSVVWTMFTGFFAYYFYLRNPKAREKIMETTSGKAFFLLLHNKYYVDEIYEIAILAPIRRLYAFLDRFDQIILDGLVNASSEFTKKIALMVTLFDKKIIDGAINGAAWITQEGGALSRKLQFGKIQTLIAGTTLIFFTVLLTTIIIIKLLPL